MVWHLSQTGPIEDIKRNLKEVGSSGACKITAQVPHPLGVYFEINLPLQCLRGVHSRISHKISVKVEGDDGLKM